VSHFCLLFLGSSAHWIGHTAVVVLGKNKYSHTLFGILPQIIFAVTVWRVWVSINRHHMYRLSLRSSDCLREIH
jgi:hypothetical protein